MAISEHVRRLRERIGRFRVTYANGDEAAYVTIVYEARAVGGVERVDGDEVAELGWFRPDGVRALALGDIALATFDALGWA